MGIFVPKNWEKRKKMEVVMKLKGKVAVITGAGAGYGMSRGFPTIYAQEGADLVLNYYGDAQEKMHSKKNWNPMGVASSFKKVISQNQKLLKI